MFQNHSNGKSHFIRIQGKLRVQTKYSDGTEKVEEWSMMPSLTSSYSYCSSNKENSNNIVLLMRKWKSSLNSSSVRLGRGSTTTSSNNSNNRTIWEYEIGGDDIDTSKTCKNSLSSVSSASSVSSLNPQPLRISSKSPHLQIEASYTHYYYKINNCPPPETNYLLSLDHETQEIVIRTRNKKYYKRFKIAALSRLNERLKEDSSSLSMEYKEKEEMLVVIYKKPLKLLEVEGLERENIEKAMKRLEKDGEVDCRQS